MSDILRHFLPPIPVVTTPLDVNAQQLKTRILRAHDEGLTGIELGGIHILPGNRKLLEENGFRFIKDRWRLEGSARWPIKLPNLLVWG